MLRHPRLWFGPVLMCVVDATVTLIGQPSAYWSGEYDQAKEANPLGLLLLHWHPLAFVAGVVFSLLFYATLIDRSPRNLARVLAFVILFLHAVGAATWFVQYGVVGYAVAIGWLAFASWLLGWSWREPRCDSAG